jgi:hypothetical protein
MGCEGFDGVEQGESTAARDAEGDEPWSVEPTMRTRIEVMFGYVSASGTSFGERISRWRRPRC